VRPHGPTNETSCCKPSAPILRELRSVDRRDETLLRHWGLVGTRFGKLVVDFIKLALFGCGIESLAERVAGRVLSVPHILAHVCLAIRIGDGNELTIAEIKAERIDIALQETIFAGVDLIERFGLIGLEAVCWRMPLI